MLGRLISYLTYFSIQNLISSLTCIIIALYFFSVNVAFVTFAFACESYSSELDFTSDRLMTEKNIKHFSDFLSATGSVILLTIIKTIILIPIH
jgi:hypothetical protein